MNNEIIVVKQSSEIDELLILNEGAVWRGMIEWRVVVNIWQGK